MPRYTEFVCGECGQTVDKLRLYVKQIVFAPLSNTKRRTKSRIVKYLCDTCLIKDADWNIETHSGPGNTSHSLQRIEQRRAGQ